MKDEERKVKRGIEQYKTKRYESNYERERIRIRDNQKLEALDIKSEL